MAPAVYLMAAPLALRNHGARALSATTLAFAFPAYSVVVGGDFMAMGRLLVPGLPFAAIVLAMALEPVLSTPGRLRGIVVAGVLMVAAVGILPAWDFHVVPETARRAFHFRHNTSTFRSEYRQWMFMNNNAKRWVRVGRALAQVAPPKASYVECAIGAVGYYSELFIWDRCGLVTREVAQRTDSTPNAAKHSPGHDMEVARKFFLHHSPTYLRAALVASSKDAKKKLKEWAVVPRIKKAYVPEVYRVDLEKRGQRLLVLRHARDGEVVSEKWDTFNGQVVRH
ncbi:MAG: hypothetical protein HN348_15550 [Proteobacteria bacterium]|nr:hypothetical protein [Pseudomonadota bacterium]